MKNVIEYNDFLNEKWDKKVKIKSTGEYSDKSIDELESQLSKLKAKSEKRQAKGKKVGKKIKEKEAEINFAIRAKRNWK